MDETVDHQQPAPCSSGSLSRRRLLRKRRVDLNALSSLSRPLVCRHRHCGIRLRDGESLEWHYQAHLARELDRLDRGVRVKKNPEDFPDRAARRNVRRTAVDRIRFRRETRETLPMSSRRASRTAEEEGEAEDEQHRRPLRCPVCEDPLDEEEDLSRHVEECLKVTPAASTSAAAAAEEEDVVDVDGREGFEEYEWAGQRRVRATSLVEGGLRGAHGFVTIVAGDEDEELDVEGDGEEEERFGRPQYGNEDVVRPDAASSDDESEDARVKSVERSDPSSSSQSARRNLASSSAPSSLSEQLRQLREDNESLRQSAPTCKVCMDSYSRPVVSSICWHVHCEGCWLRALGAKRLCPQCKVITRPQDLRRIYL